MLSCEHGGNQIPPPYRAAFKPPATVLASHRGHDPGTVDLGSRFARRTGAPLTVNRVTRLLVDANRSARNPRRFSPWALALPDELRARAVDEVWAPHRDAVRASIEARIVAGPVAHVSVHSFTPRLDGEVRDVDVGFLYDPRRPLELALVDGWLVALAALEPRLRLRRNAPYRGTADGLTTALRKVFPAARYAGLELEVSQRFPRAKGRAGARRWRALQEALIASLAEALAPRP